MEWNTVYTPAELSAHWATVAKLDPSFAHKAEAFYTGRTAAQCRGLAAGAWNCNDREGYVLATSYAAAKTAA